MSTKKELYGALIHSLESVTALLKHLAEEDGVAVTTTTGAKETKKKKTREAKSNVIKFWNEDQLTRIQELIENERDPKNVVAAMTQEFSGLDKKEIMDHLKVYEKAGKFKPVQAKKAGTEVEEAEEEEEEEEEVQPKKKQALAKTPSTVSKATPAKSASKVLPKKTDESDSD